MHTIIRVTAARKEDLRALESIGLDMNQVRPAVFSGLRRKADGFACDVSSSTDWRDHERAALDFLNTFSSHIEKVRLLGARVTMDMAFDFADFKKPVECAHFGAPLLRKLGETGVALEVTIYTGRPFS
jgi:hypothetical protein